MRVEVRPEMLVWARTRARLNQGDLVKKFPAIAAWEDGSKQPTLKQLESFASATHVPVGYLFLTEPPAEPLPVPDFRTMGDQQIEDPTPDLLDTIYQCQQRQEWYRDYARLHRENSVEVVGSMTVNDNVVDAAATLREALDFGTNQRGSSWSHAFRELVEAADQLGVLVMVNGVVGSNTHRKLDPQEFRGFALSDDLAPVVFVNGADTKAAQIFTLAHELAHIWIGESALSDVDIFRSAANDIERWCNQVAAELLLPIADLANYSLDTANVTEAIEQLARTYTVSTLVALRRLHEARLLTFDQYRQEYESEFERVLAFIRDQDRPSGGSFYNTQPVRVSKRFARALIESTLEGQTLRRDAFQMLGFKKASTFDELAHRLGVVA